MIEPTTEEMWEFFQQEDYIREMGDGEQFKFEEE